MEESSIEEKPKQKKRRRLSRKAMAAVLAVCLAAGGALSFAFFFNPTDRVVRSWTQAFKNSMDPAFDPYSSATANSSSSEADPTLPAAYDLRYDWTDVDGVQRNIITPVKLQNPWLTCWAFSAIAASESSIWAELYNAHDAQAQYTPNLSERATAWFSYHPVPEKYADTQIDENGDTEGFHNETGKPNYAFNACGHAIYATSLFAAGVGPVLEKEAPYKNEENAILVKQLVESDDSAQDDGKPHYEPVIASYTIEQVMAMPEDERESLISYTSNFEGYGDQGADTTWSVDDEIWNDSCAELEGSNILPELKISNSDDEWVGVNWEGVTAAKKEILAGRPVSVTFCADTARPGDVDDETKYIKANDDGTWAHWTYQDDAPNHAVTIVGWDDSYSKDNFVNGGPEGDGAWIVKNSWGAETEDFPNHGTWGTLDDEGKNTGFFYLSYYDRTLDCAETFNYDVSSYVYEQPEYALDQYDFLVADYRAVRTSDEPLYMANVFLTEDDQVVRTVACQTTAPNTEVTFELYLFDDNAANAAADGELNLGEPVRTATQTFEYGGYHRITLDEDEWLAMRAGQRYAVKVTQRTFDESGKATYYQNAACAMKKLTDKQREKAIEYYTNHQSAMMLDQARQAKYDELLDQGLSENEADAQADAYAKEYEQSDEYKEAVASVTEKITDAMQSYYVAVVNPGESFIGADNAGNGTDWLDWNRVTTALYKKGSAVDNLPIKAIASLADFADAQTLQSLSAAIERADALLAECAVSEDGTDVSAGTKWMTQEEHDALEAEADTARALIDDLQGNFDQASTSTPTQQAADDALDALQKANDAFAA